MKHVIKRHWTVTAVMCAALLIMAAPARAQVGKLVEPDVMLLIDTSGSMDWRKGTPENTGSWDWAKEACDNHVSGDGGLTSWQKLQSAFLGGIEGNYKCAVHQKMQRPSFFAIADDIADYVDPNRIEEYQEVGHPHFVAMSCDDADWDSNTQQCFAPARDATMVHDKKCYPNPDPTLSDEVTIAGEKYCKNWHPDRDGRQRNGILDTFGSDIRFGVMTFDNLPKCWGDCSAATNNRHHTRWDYGVYRNWNCGDVEGNTGNDVCYEWNAGIRGGVDQGYQGALGGLVGIGRRPDETHDKVSKVLNSAEPIYCSPLGSMLDDAGYYFAKEANVLPTSQGGIDHYYHCRPKYVILISDGQPTDDFEMVAGGCDIPTTETNPLVAWDPRLSGLLDHTVAEGPPFTTSAQSDVVYPCPWRASPEEAGELFDVGMRILEEDGLTPTDLVRPVFLVVVGFNVPDVDCSPTADPLPQDNASCYPYTENYKNCWVPTCGGPGPCYMTPRDMLNEIACQGWPWNPTQNFNNFYPDGSVSHVTDIKPYWIGTDVCGPDKDNYLCLDDGTTQERALFATDVNQLKNVLSMIMVEASAKAITRTDVVAWNVPNSGAADMAEQYEFRSGYVLKPGLPPTGVLTRRDWKCGDTGVDSSTIYNVAEKLLAQSNRKLLSPKPDEITYIDPAVDQLSNWINHTVPMLALDELSDCDFLRADQGLSDVCKPSCADDTSLCSYIINETKTRGLADIYNSTPAVLGKPGTEVQRQSLFQYQLDNAARRPHLFVGTNDGVLHAFDIDKIGDDSATDVERFGYVPRALLKDLRELYPEPEIDVVYNGPDVESYEVNPDITSGIYGHAYLMDGSPVAEDVLLIRPSVTDAATFSGLEEEAWRGIVFGGMGKNHRGYYALDVTEVLRTTDETIRPELRWEISPGPETEGLLYGNNDPDTWQRDALDIMGAPISKPALAYVRQRVGSVSTGPQMVMAVAIVPGGWKNDPNPNATDKVSGGNSGVYVIRLADGKVLKYLEPTHAEGTGLDGEKTICEGCRGLNSFVDTDGETKFKEGAQLIGQPVVPFGTQGLRVTHEAFIGDDRGRIWRLDLTSDNPADWKLQMYFDTLLAWHYPYENCMDSTCTPGGGLHVESCMSDATSLPCDSSLTRNMNAPRQMLLGPPATVMDEHNQLVMIFGTGQYDDLVGWTRNRIFSITHALDVSDPDNPVYKPRINWWLGDPLPGDDADDGNDAYESFTAAGTNSSWLTEIQNEMRQRHVRYPNYVGSAPNPVDFWNVGEKLIGRPVVFDGVSYFTTFVPLSDPSNPEGACEDGGSRIWALNYNMRIDTDSLGNTPDDEELGEFLDDSSGTIVRKMFRDFPGELFGGVTVVRRPTCGSDDSPFKIVVQTPPESDTPFKAGGKVPVDDAVVTTDIAIDKNANMPFVTVRFDSWSIVF